MLELIGQSLSSRYQIVGQLGAGGMGAVYKARDLTLDREVALKIMHSRLSDKSDFPQRFYQEARTAARFNHPGIVQVFDFVTTDIFNYLVMELIEGENLDQMMRRLRKKQQWITLREAVELVRQIALALDYAHRHGVVHRDIKPANIMLKEESSDDLPYRPVVADLGLAKLTEGGVETQAGITMGTPAYMSPEQTQGEEMDARSDIYSLGILLYELSVGQVPFPARTLTQALRYHVYEQPPPPHTLAADLPEDLEIIILHALEKIPANRYATAAALADALRGLTLGAAAHTIPPIAIEASSLLTQYRDSLIELRSSSIVPESLGGVSKTPSILLRTPSGAERKIPLTAPRLTVGRQPDNAIAIEDNRASRYHASVEFDGVNGWVTDLNSMNGVFIGKEQLKPNVRTRWEPGLPLRIGDHYLFLQGTTAPNEARAGDLFSQTEYTPPPRPAQRPEQRSTQRPTSQVLSIALAQNELGVEPGHSVKVPIVVQNQGQSSIQVTIQLTGVPREWIVSSLPTLTLPAGARQPATITISPPRAPQSVPKRYPLNLQAANSKTPEQKASIQGILVVTPYTQFQSTLIQTQADQHQSLIVQLENQGNTAQTFQLSWQADPDTITFAPPQVELKAAAGETMTATAKIQARRRSVLGRPQKHIVLAQVVVPGGKTETHRGLYISHPLLPAWVSLLLLGLFCGMLGGTFWYLRGLPSGSSMLWQTNRELASNTTREVTPPADTPTLSKTLATDQVGSSTTGAVNPVADNSVEATPMATATPLPTHTPIPPTATALPTATSAPTVDTAATAQVATQVAAEATNQASLTLTAAANAAIRLTAEAQATADALALNATATAGALQTAEVIRAAQAAQATQSAILTAQAPTPTPVPPPTPVRPGLVTDFESFGAWVRGNEAWGELTQSSENRAGGSFAAKLAYDFTTSQSNNDYVVFMRRPALTLPGQPKGLQIQMYGDGSGNILNAWVQDSAGIVWQFTFGKINHTGWATLSAPLDPGFGWPNSIISGGSAVAPTYPLHLYALVLDAEPRQILKGTLFLDEIFTTDTPTRPSMGGGQAPTPAPPSGGGDNSGANSTNSVCGVDPPTIQTGQNATIFWTVTGVKAVYLDGAGVSGVDKRTVSPTQTTTYTLHIIHADGSDTDCVMTVQVN